MLLSPLAPSPRCQHLPRPYILFSFISVPGHAPPSLSTICHSIPGSGWTSRPVLSVLIVGHFAVGRWEGGVRGSSCHRLMHDECPYYANESQQPLSYAPQNQLELAVMANFCICLTAKSKTIVPLQQNVSTDQTASSQELTICLKCWLTGFISASCHRDDALNGSMHSLAFLS